ncbi:MAG: hypothetical protein ACRDL5_03645, partial [Solirubrobacteraceae bacterium]
MSFRPGPRNLWACHLAVGAIACGAYAAVPALQSGHLALIALGLYALLGVIGGLILHRPADAAPWICFAVAIALLWLGVIDTAVAAPHGATMPVLADVLQLGAYAPVVGGLTLLSRRRRARVHGSELVDALIMTLGLSLIPGIFVIAPAIGDAGLGGGMRVMLIGRAVGDLLALGATIRLAIDGGRRWPSLHMLAGSIVVLLVTDFAWGVVRLGGAEGQTVWLSLGWFAFFLLWAAAILHPSMTRVAEPLRSIEQRLTAVRLSLLAGATVIAPSLVVVRTIARDDWDLLAAGGASVFLFCLVTMRMTGLVRQRERAAARERALTAAGGLLVGATDPQEIVIAALQAVAELGRDGVQARLCQIASGSVRVLAIDDRGALGDWSLSGELAALLGERSPGGTALLPAYARDQLRLAVGGDAVLKLDLGG